jgi:hypothetical protein
MLHDDLLHPIGNIAHVYSPNFLGLGLVVIA